MRKKVLALVLAFTMLVAMSLNTFANDLLEESTTSGTGTVSTCSLEAVARSGYCLNCGNNTLMTCTNDDKFYDQGPCRILWDLIEIDCHVLYYASGGVEKCHLCGNITQVYGEHYCYEVHDCSKGF